MAQCAIVHFLCLLGLCKTGLSALVKTQQTVMAAVGAEAHLSCQLKTPKDVQQVTWWKILPGGEKKSLASYDKNFGPKINPNFEDKMEFRYAGLQNTSIVIRNVMEEDEGCYQCQFTDPEGALTRKTCLKLYELHEPVLHVRESKSPSEAVVSCSATGRPAPNVSLTVPRYNSSSVTNTNGSVTVTATAVVSRLRGNSTQVVCAVEVLSVPKKEVSTVILGVKLSSDDGGKHFKRPSHNSGHNFTLIIIVLIVSVCVGAAIPFLIRWKCKKRDTEESKTPQTTDPHVAETPLMTQENELQQRSSVRNKKYNNPKAATPSGRCQPSPDSPFRVGFEQNGLKT